MKNAALFAQKASFDRSKVIIITTGGTIEKTYDEADGTLENRESQKKKLFGQRLRLPHTQLEVFSIMSKDSLFMTEDDRQFIYQTIEFHSKKNHPIVILHGTDTMSVTADYCFQKFTQNHSLPIPVVFTGAMSPMGMVDSDALQNVAESLIVAKYLNPGLYISFHNEVFEVPYVLKNKERRTFEHTSKHLK